MSNSLPIKLKVGIRDSWEVHDSQAQTAIASLKAVLGTEVTIKPQWQIIWAELQPQYPEMASFVPSVGEVVAAWCKTIQALLEDEEGNEKWIEKLLEDCIYGPSGLRVRVEVGKGKLLSTAWLADEKAFVLRLPNSGHPSLNSAIAVFHDELLECFDAKPKPQVSIPARAASHTPSSSAAATDDWADVSVDDKTGQAAAFDRPTAAPPTSTHDAPVADFLPTLGTLPRPEDLLLKPPYHLTIGRIFDEQAGLEIQCSHAPSLRLLAEYLKKWVKQNHSDVRLPSQLRVTLVESALGLGVVHDRLLVVPSARHFTACPVLVLAFVEQVLGYKLVRAGDVSWWYRRDAELKVL